MSVSYGYGSPPPSYPTSYYPSSQNTPQGNWNHQPPQDQYHDPWGGDTQYSTQPSTIYGNDYSNQQTDHNSHHFPQSYDPSSYYTWGHHPPPNDTYARPPYHGDIYSGTDHSRRDTADTASDWDGYQNASNYPQEHPFPPYPPHSQQQSNHTSWNPWQTPDDSRISASTYGGAPSADLSNPSGYSRYMKMGPDGYPLVSLSAASGPNDRLYVRHSRGNPPRPPSRPGMRSYPTTGPYSRYRQPPPDTDEDDEPPQTTANGTEWTLAKTAVTAASAAAGLVLAYNGVNLAKTVVMAPVMLPWKGVTTALGATYNVAKTAAWLTGGVGRMAGRTAADFMTGSTFKRSRRGE